MSAHKICPKCKFPLQTTHSQTIICKKCGYTQKTIKIVEDSSNFNERLHYSNRIYESTKNVKKEKRYLSYSDKLDIYLAAYQALLKNSLHEVLARLNLSEEQRQQSKLHLKDFWFTYLLQMKAHQHNISGIFRKVIKAHPNPSKSTTLPIQNPIPKSVDQDIFHEDNQPINADQDWNLHLEDAQHFKIQKEKTHTRGRKKKQTSASQPKMNHPPTDKLKEFKKFYKALLKKISDFKQQYLTRSKFSKFHYLKEIQRQYLHYVIRMPNGLTLGHADMQYMSQKYLFLLQLFESDLFEDKQQITIKTKFYVKQKSVQKYLLQRKQYRMFGSKQLNCEYLLLFDVMWEWVSWRYVLDDKTIISMEEMMAIYSEATNTQESPFISALLFQLMTQENTSHFQSSAHYNQKLKRPIPEITFSMIYAFIYITLLSIQIPITLAEILHWCPLLVISPAPSQNYQQLEPILNEQCISMKKIRKLASSLLQYINIPSKQTCTIFIEQYMKKWVLKMKILESHLPILVRLSKQLTKALSDEQDTTLQSRKQKDSSKRCIWLEQDVISLAILTIYFKLIDGMSLYPYLLTINSQFLTQNQNINRILSKIACKRDLAYFNPNGHQIIIKQYPIKCYNSFNFEEFARNLTNFTTKSQFSTNSLNKFLIYPQQNPLQALTAVSSNKLRQLFDQKNQIIKTKLHAAQNSTQEEEIKLNVNESTYKGEVLSKNKRNQEFKAKVESKQLKNRIEPEVVFHWLKEEVISQLSCIISREELDKCQLIEDAQSQKIETQKLSISQMTFDEPAVNYQLINDYSADILEQVGQVELLYLMESLCMNLCSLEEMTYWLAKLELKLKCFEN